eukprot:GEMP01017147.1.p1 GENE.GEMP01017147.1~~GEMP01017147.1.p1  ORF type:complete len:310 (+),score=42.96 GEMP01017147.1:103-1032(+)
MLSDSGDFHPVKVQLMSSICEDAEFQANYPEIFLSEKLKVKNTFLNFDSNDAATSMNISRSHTWNASTRRRLLSRSSQSLCSNDKHKHADGGDEVKEKELKGEGAEKNTYKPPFHARILSPGCYLSNYRAASTNADDVPTTMMLRNFPRRNGQKKLLCQLNARGFEGAYDFVYLPFSFAKKLNLGYAFINFRTPQKAHEFFTQWHKQIFEETEGRSHPMNVSIAEVQGKAANLERILQERKVAKISNPLYQPVVFDEQGKRMEFCKILRNHHTESKSLSAVATKSDSGGVSAQLGEGSPFTLASQSRLC